MHLVETYVSEGDPHTLQGRTYAPVCLVEDQDAMRWLLTDGLTVHAPTWARAVAAGAVGLLMTSTERDSGTVWALTSEKFAEERVEHGSSYKISAAHWSCFDRLPSYAEVILGKETALVVPATGFAHLHTHSEYSPLDGLSKVEEVVAQVKAHGQQAVALTDHGRCAGHPQLQSVCRKEGIDPIFGIEAYFADDRLVRPEAGDSKMVLTLKNDYFHLILLAQNDEGLKNLWAMSTESFRDGFYYRPRMDWDTLRRHSAGIVASSACLRGPISVPILDDDEALARTRLARLLDIFGDRFYLEIQPNNLPEQRKVNHALVGLAKDFGVPLLATADAHYPTEADHAAHETWIALQTNSDVNDEGDLFAVNLDLYVQSEAKVREGLAYLGAAAVDEAVKNTVLVANQCKASIGGKPTAPVYSKKGGQERDVERLLDLCLANWAKVEHKAADPDTYMERFEYEFGLLSKKGFCGYFLMVADYCRYAKQNGILVGPGRGSGGGSLVAYLCDITEVDPVEADLPFERFMTEGRTELPDFDVDFPASKKGVMLKYLRDTYGEDHVISIGTHLRLKAKGIIKDLGRALMSVLTERELAVLREAERSEDRWAIQRAKEALGTRIAEINKDLAAASNIVKAAEAGTAGLGLSWEELWAQFGDELEPYRTKYPAIFNMADHLVGRLKTYGKHAAGVVISTDRPLTDWLPLSSGEDDEQMVSQFDMNALTDMGLVKFDILTIRTLDTVQMAVDLIRDRRGIDVDIYAWKEEYQDPQVWAEIAAAKTLGIFQIETKSGTRLCKQMGPLTLGEFCDMITIVRPGPMRSGLTDTYLKRRAGLEPVAFPDPRLEQYLGNTWGCMIYQEQIMQACMHLAGYGSDEADKVRKILGKKKVEAIGPAGQEFVSRAVEWGGMDREVASHLWDQMAEFAKYSFGKAHAYAYAVLGYWTAWLKFHYPVEFYVAALSTIDQDRIPEFIKELRRNGFAVLPPDVNASGRGFKAEPLAVRYGLDAIRGVGATAVEYLEAGQPYASLAQFEEYTGQKGTKANSGVVTALAKVGALDSLEPRRAGLLARLEAAKDGTDARCQRKDERAQGPNGLPCTFDWSSEPVPLNPRTGKKLKPKDPPKKCTRACRQYVAPAPLDLATVPELTGEQIRTMEHGLLGVFLSSTPFDRLDPADRSQLLASAEELVEGPPKQYALAAILMGVRKTKTRAAQEDMAFLTLDTEVETVEAVCFPQTWASIEHVLHDGQLCLVVLEKQSDERGLVLREYVPIP